MEWQNRIEDKIDKIADRLESITITAAKQEENLKEHMRRTEIAENNINLIVKKLTPIESHVEKVKGAIILLSTIGSIVVIVAAFYEILTHYK